jgi:hypothetical protein
MLQAIHDMSVMFPHQYWCGVIVLLILVCAGWFKLGTMRLAVAGPAPARPRLVIYWQPNPFLHRIIATIAGVQIVGTLMADVDHLAASVAVKIQL